MSVFNSLPPVFFYGIAALLLPFVKGKARNIVAALIPAVAFFHILGLDPNSQYIVTFADQSVNLLRVDAISKTFGLIFTLSSFFALIYAYYEDKALPILATMAYVGAALGVVFTSHLFALYIFWEVMAVSSVFLILARKTKRSFDAATRYILIHVLGGLVLLAGIIMYIGQTGSMDFVGFAPNIATYLILIGVLINAAAYPFSSWLPDAYPEATVMGTVVLSAYTTKTAVYALIRGFAGWDILIIVGIVMAIYGIIYALLESDIRRALAFCIVNQVGFMVIAVGIGTPLAIAGATAHAFCHIIYKSLLFMGCGVVLKQTGQSNLNKLGGLYSSMPKTFWLMMIGGLSIAAPLTVGIVSKPIIFAAAEHEHLFWPWLIMEVTAALVFLVAAIKIPYGIFFAKSSDSHKNVKDAPISMQIAMAGLGICSLAIGIYPKILVQFLPHSYEVMKVLPSTFSTLYIYHPAKWIVKIQIMAFTALAFFIFRKLFVTTKGITLDVDWIYRKGADGFYRIMDICLNGFNKLAEQYVIFGVVKDGSKWAQNLSIHVVSSSMGAFWLFKGYSLFTIDKYQKKLQKDFDAGTIPIGISAVLILLVFIVVTLL